MYAGNSITALVVIATLVLHGGCQSQTPCTDGWFGPNCQYQCHCAGSAPCDKNDGSCSSGCHQDWFGPACQYDRMRYSGPGWLTDSDDTTCNTGNTQSVTVTLDTAIPLTWVRVVVTGAGDPHQVQLIFQACLGLRKAKVDDRTLDIECSTTEPVSEVTLSGSGVTGLCSLYISGGRNVALKQSALQSSRYNPRNNQIDWLASYAVDGTTGGGNDRSTCTHTLGVPVAASPGSWTVTFSQAADVTRFLIHNRDNCCKDRLAGFTLTAQSDSSTTTPYSYTDSGGSGQDSYTVVPSPRISFSVSLVRFVTAHSTNILSLCEVFVFGETKCPAGKFGLRCERQCHCTRQESCFVHSGGCPSGCAIGYTGEDCSECNTGTYGAGCSETCSNNCAGQNNDCHHVTGTCTAGCDPGYWGSKCSQSCSSHCAGPDNACNRDTGACTGGCELGYWGEKCSQSCSSHCVRADNACNRDTGACTGGCEPGYKAPNCDQKCNTGTYGAGCSETCSNTCAGQNNDCDHATGTCTGGCDPGFWGGNKCRQSCSIRCARSDNACNRDTGACTGGCEPGYKAPNCDQKCDPGTYGAGCSERCSVNCAGPKNACNHVTGTCDVGCDFGYWGDKCLNPCSSNCAGQDNACNSNNGHCNEGCDPGYRGNRCSQICETGKYGAGCTETCSAHCAGSGDLCNHITGKCDSGCDPGYKWEKCIQECDPGTYGDGCSGRCSVNCAGQNNTCNHVTGTCDVGCDVGYWGNKCLNNCSITCGGSDKACDRDTGDCQSCPPGLQGAKCDQECDIGYYGAGCNATCSDHCRGNQSLCDHVNGTCDLGCDPGYQDSLCTIECASGTWGDNCQNQCNSACTSGTCDHVIGTCDCNPGYWGNLCDHKCNATTYGDGCQTPCSLDCVEQLCDHVTGQCDSCAADRTGLFCQTMIQKQQGGDGGTPTATIVGVVIAVVVILVVIAAVVIFWRRRTHKADEKQLAEDGEAQGSEYANFGAGFHQNGSSDQHAKDLISPQSLTPKSNAGFVTDDETGNIYSIILTGNTALSMETLKATILQPSADSHFKDEFSSIPMANNSPQTAGLAEKNVKKNRYKNIIPYDSSRVLLQADHSKGHSDYINASFVKGYKKGESFIASQGPNDLILNDFVRMLWEQKVDKVVMLTNLIELGKKKCNMYWPTEGEEEYDEVTVGLLTTHVFADYTIRHLRLSKSGEPARDVTQFHFTAWPDKSVPESPWGLVDFHQRVMAVPGSGPVLVHCSAGVGRTGTFIALCNLLQEAEDTGKMNFLDTLWKLRQDRMHTIQTVAQYMFLHKAALVGHTLAGSTIQVKDMYERLSALESENGRSFGQEFEAVVAVCAATIQQAKESREEPEESVYNNTGSAGNKSKNRLSNILANEAFRPVLIAEAHNEDTYINAVFVPSLTQSNHDLLTQLPLPSTVTDFWRLVTQFNVGLVVAFDVDSGNSDETIGEFLPNSETEPFENDRFLVEARLPSESKLFNKFTLIVHQKLVPGMDHSGAPKVKNLTLLVCKNPHLDPKSILELQEKIKSCRPSGKSRVVYMSRNGADHCGLMCVQSILLDRLEADQCLTVPLVVGSIKAIRPQVITTVDEYKCLYQVLKLVHEGQNEYGNM